MGGFSAFVVRAGWVAGGEMSVPFVLVGGLEGERNDSVCAGRGCVICDSVHLVLFGHTRSTLVVACSKRSHNPKSLLILLCKVQEQGEL